MLVAQSCLTLCKPTDCSPPDSSVHGILQARIGVDCHFLLQRIFPTQGSNPGLLHCRLILYCLTYWEVPEIDLVVEIYGSHEEVCPFCEFLGVVVVGETVLIVDLGGSAPIAQSHFSKAKVFQILPFPEFFSCECSCPRIPGPQTTAWIVWAGPLA